MTYDNAFILSGYPASGKSTALEVARGFGNIWCFETSDFVRNYFRMEEGGDIDDNGLGEWASGLRDKHGKDHFIKQLIERTIENEVPATKSVAVSGIRCPEEVQAFIESELFDHVTVIGVIANEEVRWRRVKERDNMDRQTFNQRNVREEDWGTDTVLKYADIHLVNEWTTEERFRNKVKGTFESLLQSPVQSWK